MNGSLPFKIYTKFIRSKELIKRTLKINFRRKVWDFSKSHGRNFDELKPTISNCGSLKFFDPKLQTKITCDASKCGLGATL